jgi:hypothetical protein
MDPRIVGVSTSSLEVKSKEGYIVLQLIKYDQKTTSMILNEVYPGVLKGRIPPYAGPHINGYIFMLAIIAPYLLSQ